MKQYFSGIAAILVCMGVGSVLAEEAKHEEKPVNATEIVNSVCVACHGEDGNKMLTPETPRLVARQVIIWRKHCTTTGPGNARTRLWVQLPSRSVTQRSKHWHITFLPSRRNCLRSIEPAIN
jgi:hypothetical protein